MARAARAQLETDSLMYNAFEGKWNQQRYRRLVFLLWNC